MATWEGERHKSSLILEQAEFDRLPNAIKEDNGGNCVFYQQDAWLALFGLPHLLLQYPVSGIADWDHEQAVRISYAHGALLDRIRTRASARHVPDSVHAVPEIPRTLTGKKMEVPVRKLLLGAPVEKVASPDAMANPTSLAYFVRLAAGQSPSS